MATIKSISTLIIDGDWIESKDQSPGGIRLIQTGNIGIGKYLDKANRAKYISEETLDRLNCTELLAGDILVSRLPDPIGRACVVPNNIGRAITAVDCTIIRLDSRKWRTEYFVQYTQSELYQNRLSQFFAGSTRIRISRKTLEQIEIPLPNIIEQKRVASTLGKVDALISLRKQQLAKMDELVKARFVELFGECQEHKRLEEYAALITKGASPKWQGVDYCEEGTLFVTSENVREGYLDLSKRKYLDDKINEIQPRSILKRNDILINIVGASIGRAAVYDCDEVANINQAVALVRVNYSQINQTYLMTFLNSPQAIEMYGKMKKGGARDNLSLQNIADLQIPVAPMELQNQFATFVEQTDKSKLVIQQSLDKLETLKKSLMQKYFG